MQAVMAVMLGAMRQDAQRVERVAVNLANALTPGFQREMIVAQPATISAHGGFARLVAAADDDASHVAASTAVVRDARPGSLKPTGQPWDLALASGGYFEVQAPGGAVYSRRGQFQLDAQGRLVAPQGWPVMGLGGEIRPGSEPVTVEPNGQIRAGGRTIAQLKLVHFDDPGRLTHVEGGYFVSDAAPSVLPEAQANVRQGHLENANVSHGHEMVQLMQTLRHYESMTRLLQGYDDMLGGAIRRLGDH
jgi:flagellar basal-body rod protein FlgF